MMREFEPREVVDRRLLSDLSSDRHNVYVGYLRILRLHPDTQGCLLRPRIGQKFANLGLRGFRDQESLDSHRQEPTGEGEHVTLGRKITATVSDLI